MALKKTWLKFLILSLFCGALSLGLVGSYALDLSKTETFGDYKYFVTEDGSGVEIVVYTGSERHLVIPNEMDGLPVVAIGRSVFFRKELESVTLPKGLKEIGEHAFSDNALEHIVFPESLTQVGDWAFAWNKITSVDLPKNMKEIPNALFWENKITHIDIPHGVEVIGSSVFIRNELVSVTLPSTLKAIGDSAFSTNKITHIVLPEGLEEIGQAAFYKNRLTSLIFPESLKHSGDWSFNHNWLVVISIGENVSLDRGIGNNHFDEHYVNNGSKSGTYEYDKQTGKWLWREGALEIDASRVILGKTVIDLQINNPTMWVNGINQSIEVGEEVMPVLIGGRTLLPIRAIVLALGGGIEHDGAEGKMIIKANGNVIEVWLDGSKAMVNGVEKPLDAKPVMMNYRTMLPVRFVAENLEANVEWDSKTETVRIIR